MRDIAFVSLVLAAVSLPKHAAAQEWRLGTGYEISEGNFGLGDETTIKIATAEVSIGAPKWSAKVTVPHVSVDGPTGFVVQGATGTTLPTQTRLSGLGDIRLTGMRTFYLAGNSTLLDLSASIKLPTADPDDLLGTGEVDVTFRADATRQWGRLSGTAGIGHTVAGDTDLFPVQDRTQVNAGGLFAVTEVLSAGLVYEWREPVLEGLDDVRETTGYVVYDLSPQTSVAAYAFTGETETSPDVGAGLRLTYRR